MYRTVSLLLLLAGTSMGAGEPQWVVYDGYDEPGYGRHVVLISGDEEYRSEEALPQLGKILAQRQGFKCTVLFAQDPSRPGIVDPNYLGNIPGLEALRTADLMIIATRFRALPDEQMQEIDDYLRSGRPVVGLRTANHGFRFPADSKWAHYSWQYDGEKEYWEGGFGQPILGSIFFSHHGSHGQESTRGLIAPGAKGHPVLRGIKDGDIWGPTDVYGVKLPLPGDAEALVLGQVLAGMEAGDAPLGPGPYEKAPDYVTKGSNDKNNPMMPVAWTMSYEVPGGRKGRVFSTTMGAADDLASEGTRRLIVQGALWCLGIDPPAEGADVEVVGEFEPSPFGTRKGDFWMQRNLRVEDFACEIEVEDPYAGTPVEPAYADVRGGREGYEFADHARNRFRLYDFYRRQAEDALSRPEQRSILPEYPGIDGGAFGHWGRYSKNSFKDRSWSLMEHDAVCSGILRVEEDAKGGALPRAVAVRLGGEGDLAVSFDTETLRYAHLWRGGFISFFPNRYGIGGGIYVDGEVALESPDLVGWTPGGSFSGREYPEGAKVYRGHYRNGARAIFDYAVNGLEVLDSPGTIGGPGGGMLVRDLEFGSATEGAFLGLFLFEKASLANEMVRNGRSFVVQRNGARAVVYGLAEGGKARKASFPAARAGFSSVRLTNIAAGDRVRVYAWEGRVEDVSAAIEAIGADGGPLDLRALTKGGEAKWAWRFTEKAKLGEKGKDPFVIDRIPVPVRNPYGSVMMIGGHDFYSDGDAAVCTMAGDVWRVSGLDADLGEVTWRRIATGINQALGIWIERNERGDELFVLGRDRINRLHDLNGDGEIDLYENFSDAFETSEGGHDFFTGLQRDGEGNFYFAAAGRIVRISADGSRGSDIATGLRNTNGIGVNREGVVITNTNEGDWTPTNMVLEIQEGDFYGRQATKENTIAPALSYVPRGIDNSAGGQIFVTSDRWGPLRDRVLSFSYGAGVWYLVLRSEVEDRTQGAIVPLPGDFASGAHRGRFGPHDGQLYVSGSEGWGNYAVADGSFDRVRYTGGKMHLPVDWRALANGLVVRFSDEVDEASLDPRNFICQQWNYEYSAGYGSAEYSVREPGTTGHDVVPIRSVRLLYDRRTVFLEIPGLLPACQTHLFGRLRDVDGEALDLDIYATILNLDASFTGFAEAAAIESGKARALHLRVRYPAPKRKKSDAPVEAGRPVTIATAAGLKFATTEFSVKAGERISLTLDNVDTLPHNLVIVKPGAGAAVGELANAMMTDPEAVERHYVPDSPEVLFATELLDPHRVETIHFSAPEIPGEYPYLCTFPGHWMLMQGKMVVKAADPAGPTGLRD